MMTLVGLLGILVAIGLFVRHIWPWWKGVRGHKIASRSHEIALMRAKAFHNQNKPAPDDLVERVRIAYAQTWKCYDQVYHHTMWLLTAAALAFVSTLFL
jgi:hypothetical protein